MDCLGYLQITCIPWKETWKTFMAIHRIDETRKGELDRLMRTKGKHSDGGGLYLQVAAPGQASWVYRHKERWKSIGPANAFTIADAREKARLLRVEVAEKRDPFLLKRVTDAAGKTFADAMAEYLKAKSPHWAASNRARELRRYEYLFGQIPRFTALHLSAIDQAAKNKALSSWDGQPKARRDVGFYIEAIIRFAETGKLRLPSNSLDQEHYEAMPYRDVPGFYAGLAKLNSDDARALQWTILTGARTGEVIGAEFKGRITKTPATWAEITDVSDSDGKGQPTWIIPGGLDGHMKAKKTHRVPLTRQMVELIGQRRDDDVPLFDVSNLNALRDTLKANGGNGYTVHGMRSSFEDWAAETTDFPRDLVKLCTAHDKRTKVDKAYQRSDLLEKRRVIMQAWSDYVARPWRIKG
jgi:integrase